MAAVLDQETLARLAASPEAVREFPFLRSAARRSVSCCGRAAATPGRLRAAAEAISALPPGRRAVLKALVGTDRLTVYVVRAGRLTPTEI